MFVRAAEIHNVPIWLVQCTCPAPAGRPAAVIRVGGPGHGADILPKLLQNAPHICVCVIYESENGGNTR